jgi:hypothetical protein
MKGVTVPRTSRNLQMPAERHEGGGARKRALHLTNSDLNLQIGRLMRGTMAYMIPLCVCQCLCLPPAASRYLQQQQQQPEQQEEEEEEFFHNAVLQYLAYLTIVRACLYQPLLL